MNSKILVMGALLSLTTAVSADDYSQWTTYKNITINTATAGVATNVTNFPTLVRLTAADSVMNIAGSRSSLRFARGAKHLPYQIEQWDSAGQAAAIWVLVDTVFGNTAGQTIRMYWGKAGAADSSNGGAVFTAANGFVGAWHLGDAAGVSPRPNSVTGAPPATPSNDAGSFGGGAGTYVIPTGVIGKADVIRGGGSRAAPVATSDYLDLGSNSTGSTVSPYSGNNTYTGYTDFSNGFTYSFWVNPGTATGNFSYMLELSNGNFATDNIQFFRPNQATTYRYEHTVGGTSAGIKTTATGSMVLATWQHIVVTVGTGATPAVTIYKNGAVSLAASNETAPIASVLRANAWIGKSNYDGDAYFVGSFDEPEISNVARSADWIKLSYATQVTGQTTVTLGASINAPPQGLTYAPNPAVYTVGYPIPTNNPTVTGAVTGYSVAPALPAGLSLNATTGAITGTPTAATAAAGYVVTVTNAGGTDTETVNITINAALVAPTNLSYSQNPVVYGLNTAITPNNPTVTGTVTGYSVAPNLPVGLTLNASTGVISGTPLLATPAANYVVTATNSAGSTTVSVNIAVIAAPTNLSYSTPTANYPATRAITNNTPTVTGSVTGYSVNPPLPAGLSLNATTGVISGTPTAVTPAANYTVTASNSSGSTTAIVNIAVYGPPTGLYYAANPSAYLPNQAIPPNTATVTGTVTRYSVSPALPTGLILDTLTGTVSGTPTVPNGGYVTYTVSATNGAGSVTVDLLIWIQNSTAISQASSNSFMFRVSGASPVSFRIPDGAKKVHLSIVDVWGRSVWSQTVESVKMNGVRELSWDGVASNGQHIGAGLYFARIRIVNANGTSSGIVEKKINYTP